MNSDPAPSSREPTPSQIIAAEQARGPIRVVLEQPRYGWIGRGLRWAVSIILFLVVASLFVNSYDTPGGEVHERWHSLSHGGTDKVAIITVEGTILGEEGFVKK